MLQVNNLSVQYGERTVVDKVSFSVREGQWLMIVGPNGAGKSTVLNAVSQGVAYSGEVLYQGKNVKAQRPSERAQCIGVLTQSHFVGYSFTVEEIVRLGRYAYSSGPFSGRDNMEDQMVELALNATGMSAQKEQSVMTLSGGELQRAFLAQVFAQNPHLLLLDEPTNHLDLVYQKQIFTLISEWLKTPNRAVVSVVHDLSLAKAFGSHAILLDHGKCVAQGVTGQVLCADNLNRVYGMDVAEWMRGMLSQWEP